jgi:hypothetical protein
MKGKGTMWKKVGGRKYFKYSECEAGSVLVDGLEFIGTEQGKFGVIHVFSDDHGGETVLNSSGQLNYLVDRYLKTGDKCRVVYQGKAKLTKGAMAGKEAHNFELFIAGEEAPAHTDADIPPPSDDDFSTIM